MSAAENTAEMTETGAPQSIDWGLVRRQLQGVLRMELRSTLFGKRMLAVLFLAFAPVGLIALWALTPLPQEMAEGPAEAARIFSYFYAPYLGTSVFLSCLIVFMSLFRNEIQDKTLHYYYLSPVRREVVVVAKYLAGLASVVAVYVVGTTMFYLFMTAPWGLAEMSRHLMRGPGLGHLFTYVGLSVLACVGFGALFLLAGLLLRNPIVAAIIVWMWEGASPFLPATLKKLTISFYLTSMYPIPVKSGPFSIFAEPVPPYLAIPGLLLVSAGIVALACWRARSMEVTYGGEE